MANVLPMHKQVMVISALTGGSSIRAIERMFDVHRDTIMRLGVRIGEGCTRLLDRLMRNLECKSLQMDEIWGFVGKKQRQVKPTNGPDVGDAWTFICLDADSKLVPAFRVGRRDLATAIAFVEDLAGHMTNRVQHSNDALRAYVEAVERGFGGEVDYGTIVQSFEATDPLPSSTRYSPPAVVSVTRHVIEGKPDFDHISTSFIEKQNHTVRMHCRRLTRLTNAFSKRLVNFKAAVGLHFGYYNLVKVHKSLRMTPALKARVVSSLWSVEDLIRAAREAARTIPTSSGPRFGAFTGATRATLNRCPS
jgi:IS1 family transposase